jgi:hypothetical protein
VTLSATLAPGLAGHLAACGAARARAIGRLVPRDRALVARSTLRPLSEAKKPPGAPVLTQHAADRLDPEPGLMTGDEPHECVCGRSNSAAKKADAALRISFARRSSAFSASAA